MSAARVVSGIAPLLPLAVLVMHASPSEAEEDPYFRYLKDGARQVRAGNLAPALESFRDAVRADPFQMDAYFNAGNVARRLGRCPDVIKYFQGFLALSPGTSDDAIARKGMAGCERKSGMGSLTVETGSDGNWVLLDDGVIGRTPLKGAQVAPGKYGIRVTCRCPDFEDAKRLIEIEASGTTALEMSLVAKVTWGSLHVVTEPAEGVAVFVDDTEIGVTPLEPIRAEAGRRFIRLEKPGFHRWVRNVVIERDRMETVRAALEPVEGGPGDKQSNPGER